MKTPALVAFALLTTFASGAAIPTTCPPALAADKFSATVVKATAAFRKLCVETAPERRASSAKLTKLHKKLADAVADQELSSDELLDAEIAYINGWNSADKLSAPLVDAIGGALMKYLKSSSGMDTKMDDIRLFGKWQDAALACLPVLDQELVDRTTHEFLRRLGIEERRDEDMVAALNGQ